MQISLRNCEMRQTLLILTIILFVMLMSEVSYAELSWQRITVDADVSTVRAIAIDKNNSLYVGLDKGLYKTVAGGRSWRLLGARQITEVNFLYIDKEDVNTIYSATKDGLFKSKDAGKRWQKIFVGKDVLEKDVLTVALSYEPPKTIFIGTRSGVFFTPADRIVWQKTGGKLNDAGIFSIAALPNSEAIFIVSSKGVFRSANKMSSYERIYTPFNLESEDSTTDLDSEEEEVNWQDYFIRHISFDPKNTSNLYLSTKKGLVFSNDEGRSWQKIVFSGLFEEDINYSVVSSDRNIYLATKNGVFKCRDEACKELFKGADFKNCNQLAEDSQNNLYLASDKGLFRRTLSGLIQEGIVPKVRSKSIGRNEPTIQEIQKVAVKYAEVHPEKIINWRRQARLRAFLPELDLSYDKTVFTSTSFPQGRGFVGPLDWGVTLKWDLADFIYSDDQTSIDVRSRLMVQLRDDILNEVTRLYFERRRLQFELEEENLSDKTRADKLLRLEELTALIDGLTGEYLTKNSKKM